MDEIKDDKFYVEKILECIETIQNFYNGKTREDLENNQMLNNTIMFQFMLMGEYSTRLSQEYRDKKTAVPWIRIKGLRNNVVHNYDRVIYEVVDETIISDLPVLKEELLKNEI